MAKRLGTRRALIVGLIALGLIAVFVGVASGNHIFSDVPTNAYYHAEVSWLYNNGIVSGCGSGKYCPNDPFTRGQAAEMLYKFATRTRTAYYSCDQYEFNAAASDVNYSAGVLGLNSDGPMSCGVHLPQGAHLTKMTAAVHDNDGTHSSNCYLYEQLLSSDPSNYSALGVVQTTIAGVSTQWQQLQTTLNATVNNNTSSYMVECFPVPVESNATAVAGVRFEYTYLGIPAP